MSEYPANYYDDDWGRIHKGHGLSRHTLWTDLNEALPQPADSYFKVVELHLRELPHVKWCERYDHPCEFNGEWHRHWSGVRAPGTEDSKYTLAKWAKLSTVGFKTLQFGNRDGTWDYTAHLVRSTQRGTPGPTLCGIERFGKDAPGWSVGGGVSGPGIVHTPCVDCAAEAAGGYPELPVSGLGAVEITETIRRFRRATA